MKIIITENQYNDLFKRKTDKFKEFLKNELDLDFLNSIEMVTSTYDVPMEFDECYSTPYLRRILNNWGPMYLFKYNHMMWLYQKRSDFEWFMNEDCNDYVDNEILDWIGISDYGFKFSDIIDLFFEENEN